MMVKRVYNSGCGALMCAECVVPAKGCSEGKGSHAQERLYR